jgi:chromosome segregation ATPase
MDVNMNGRLNISKSDDRQVLNRNERGADYGYIQKKKEKNPAFDGLAKVITEANNPPKPKDEEESQGKKISGELDVIDGELSDIEKEIAEFNANGANEMDVKKKILEKLSAIQKRLDEIQNEISQLANASRERNHDCRKQDAQFAQVNILRGMLESHREKCDPSPDANQTIAV